MNVAIVGKFPVGATEMFKKSLSKTGVRLKIVDTPEKYLELKDAECIILRIFKITKDDIDRNPNLKFIQKWGTGFDTIDIKAAGEKNILVSNVPGANAEMVSELTVLLMLSVYRNLIKHHQSMLSGKWTKTQFVDTTYSLINKKIGLIGGGNIGQKVAKKVNAFGSDVQYYDIFRLSQDLEEEYKMKYVELDELIKTSDIISLHLPLNYNTKNIINSNNLNMMKKGSVIINTGRGGLIDEEALIKALSSGHLLGAGLDCFSNEPVDINNPILKAPNVVLTPHIGGTSMDLLGFMVPEIIRNILNFVDSKPVNYVLNNNYLK